MQFAWGRPGNSRAFHIFTADSRSLCMKWLYGGADQEIKPDLIVKHAAGDCKECVKRFNARLETGKGQ